jgi:hypothetical protein
MESTSEAPFIFQSCNDPRATINVVQRFDGRPHGVIALSQHAERRNYGQIAEFGRIAI